MQSNLEIVVFKSLHQRLDRRIADLRQGNRRAHTHEFRGVFEQCDQPFNGLGVANPAERFGGRRPDRPILISQGGDQTVHGTLVFLQPECPRRALPDPPPIIAQCRHQPLHRGGTERDKIRYRPVPALLDGVPQHRNEGLPHARAAKLGQCVPGVHPDRPEVILQGFNQRVGRAGIRMRHQRLRRLFPGRIIRIGQCFQPVRQRLCHSHVPSFISSRPWDAIRPRRESPARDTEYSNPFLPSSPPAVAVRREAPSCPMPLPHLPAIEYPSKL